MRYKDRVFDYFPPETRISIAIGQGHAEVPAGTLLVGNCTACHRDLGIFVPGCPPVGSQILAALSGTPSPDDPADQEHPPSCRP
jgi:Ni,Fe-hydrogenase III small subunit